MDREKIKSVHLVEEIIEEILSRLPVKSVSRFRCVSKSWLSLISSERFIESHLRKSTENRVIFECDRRVLNECSLHQLLNEPSSIEHSPIYDPTDNEPMKGDVVGCCNGLICINKSINNISLWNPASRICIELPKLNCSTDKQGFGWDRKSGAYKVFVYSTDLQGISEAKVYSSKTNSWKTVEHGCQSLYEINGVFACGKIHWLVDGKVEYIESWDLESEEFGRIEIPCKPKCYYGRHYALAEIGGFLHLLCIHDDHDQQSYAVICVMKESGWLKLFTLPLSFVPDYLSIQPLFAGGPNGEILLIFEKNYMVYSPKEDVLHAGENRTSFTDGFVYVESLVSPNFTTAS